MTPPTEFNSVTQITLYKWSCGQSLLILAFLYSLWEKFYKDLNRKTYSFEGCSWFKLSDLELALGMSLKLYTIVTKGLKIKARKYLWLISTFVEVTRRKASRVDFLLSPLILKSVKSYLVLILASSSIYIGNFYISTN